MAPYLLLFSFFLVEGAAGSDPTYLDQLSFESDKTLRKIMSASIPTQEVKLAEWARDRLAWVALKRLQGKDAEAIKILEGCTELCEKYGQKEEWLGHKDWACQKKKVSLFCGKKTKAQKPPR